MDKNHILVGIGTLLSASVAVIVLAPVTGTSKPKPKAVAAMLKKEGSQRDERMRNWKPVQAAILSGNVGQVRAASRSFQDAGFFASDDLHANLARFYASRGDVRDAKGELDLIVFRNRRDPPRSIPGIRRSMGGITRPSQSYDARYLQMWLQLSPEATGQARRGAMERWAEGYRKEAISPGAFKELSSEALLEFTLGQEYFSNPSTWQEAAMHYRKAYALAPRSLLVGQTLIGALQSVNDAAGAYRVPRKSPDSPTILL